MAYVIRFDFPEGAPPVFAAIFDEGLAWTLRPENALRFDDYDSAARTLFNGYGVETRSYGSVVGGQEKIPEVNG